MKALFSFFIVLSMCFSPMLLQADEIAQQTSTDGLTHGHSPHPFFNQDETDRVRVILKNVKDLDEAELINFLAYLPLGLSNANTSLRRTPFSMGFGGKVSMHAKNSTFATSKYAWRQNLTSPSTALAVSSASLAALATQGAQKGNTIKVLTWFYRSVFRSKSGVVTGVWLGSSALLGWNMAMPIKYTIQDYMEGNPVHLRTDNIAFSNTACWVTVNRVDKSKMAGFIQLDYQLNDKCYSNSADGFEGQVFIPVASDGSAGNLRVMLEKDTQTVHYVLDPEQKEFKILETIHY